MTPPALGRSPSRPDGSARAAWLRWGGAALVAGVIAAAGWKKRALTGSGAAAAAAMGTVTFARGGLPAAVALNAFFVSSSALSRFKAREKGRRGVLAQAKGSERDAWQVLANGGVAATCLGLFGDRGTGAFLGALAAAGADTWATELGLLAAHPPRLLTTLRPVPPGTSGGVTPQGTLAAVAGAATVGAAWAVAEQFKVQRPALREAKGSRFKEELPAVPSTLNFGLGTFDSGYRTRGAVAVVAVAGTAGALVDSCLGATVQAAYWCPNCREATESPHYRRCGQLAEQVRGWRWMDNDAVNTLATATGALLGALLWPLAPRP